MPEGLVILKHGFTLAVYPRFQSFKAFVKSDLGVGGDFAKAGIATRRYAKPTNTKVAPVELMQKIAAEAQLAVIALSD